MILRVFTGFFMSIVLSTSVHGIALSTWQAPYFQRSDDAHSGRMLYHPSAFKSFMLAADIIGKSPEYVEQYINEKHYHSPTGKPYYPAVIGVCLGSAIVIAGLSYILYIVGNDLNRSCTEQRACTF